MWKIEKMLRRDVITVSSLFLVFFGGVTSLRDVKLLVRPSVVIRNGTASLICSRDMQGAPLYSVKWYRGNHEFYRYTPLETPQTRVFGLPGIYVDMNNSNGSQVLLKHMDITLAGNFSCEVTADASFATQIDTKFVDVVCLPTFDPVLKADKDRYQPGEILRANCSSSPAKPAANLTISVNGEPLLASETSLHPSESGLLWTRVHADIKVTPDLFISGRLRVACVATVYDVYKRSAKLDFFTPEADPRPERITLNGGATACGTFNKWILLFLLFFLPMLVSSDDYTLDDGGDYYDDNTRLRQAALTLIHL
ncbi:uncharacterized protein LOC106133062 [Amyelois transitella]|uniref:uncharacterized protein LOC106133062 n=1 Tax=Amyelois transitella TaxID=680683 RepID=UPI00298FED49|nr:uncharacterized protein LOC106133062 [Amyelois transitella]